MVGVFEEQIIKITLQKLQETLEKLKYDKLLQKKLRELTETLDTLEKINVIINDIGLDKEDKDEWIEKRDRLIEKRDEIYSKLKNEGFECGWINTIVKYERENLKNFLKDARESAYKKFFGTVDIKGIDILDNRWELVGKQLEQAKINYIQGE